MYFSKEDVFFRYPNPNTLRHLLFGRSVHYMFYYEDENYVLPSIKLHESTLYEAYLPRDKSSDTRNNFPNLHSVHLTNVVLSKPHPTFGGHAIKYNQLQSLALESCKNAADLLLALAQQPITEMQDFYFRHSWTHDISLTDRTVDSLKRFLTSFHGLRTIKILVYGPGRPEDALDPTIVLANHSPTIRSLVWEWRTSSTQLSPALFSDARFCHNLSYAQVEWLSRQCRELKQLGCTLDWYLDLDYVCSYKFPL